MARPDEELWTDVARVFIASEDLPRKQRIDRLWRLVLAYRREGFNGVGVNTSGKVNRRGNPCNSKIIPLTSPDTDKTSAAEPASG